MSSVFGSLSASLMKYLSPIGVCLTVASNTEQSGEKIDDHLNIVGTWRTWTFARDLLDSDISWVGQVRLGASHNCMVWIFLHFDQSVHLVNAPVMACFSIDQEDKIFNHLCMVRAHRSFPLVSRFQRWVSWRRICPDESECRICAPEVFPRRRSPCRSLCPSMDQTRNVLNTQVRLICACLCIVTCASYVSTRLLLQ